MPKGHLYSGPFSMAGQTVGIGKGLLIDYLYSEFQKNSDKVLIWRVSR